MSTFIELKFWDLIIYLVQNTIRFDHFFECLEIVVEERDLERIPMELLKHAEIDDHFGRKAITFKD